MPEYVRVGALGLLGVPFGRTKIIAMTKANEFPEPIRPGAHRMWRTEDVKGWVARNLAKRN
jgi:predicted DNA-binding transcriptional regulator AlpA